MAQINSVMTSADDTLPTSLAHFLCRWRPARESLPPYQAICLPDERRRAVAALWIPRNSTAYMGCTLCEIDVDHFCNWGGAVMFVTNAVVVLTAVLTGVMVL